MRIVSFLALSLVLCSCSTLNRWCGLEDDNFIEEAVEDVVQHETGLNFDFTPNSPEVKK